MCSASTSWGDLEVLMERFLDGDDFGGGACYDLSKAGLMVYTMQLAAQYPNIKVRSELILLECIKILLSDASINTN